MKEPEIFDPLKALMLPAPPPNGAENVTVEFEMLGTKRSPDIPIPYNVWNLGYDPDDTSWNWG